MPPYPIIALGDSLTYGYPFGKPLSWVTVTSKELGVPILNQGVNGDTLIRLTKRLNTDVLDLKPDICLVLGGTNDVIQGEDIEIMKTSFSQLLERMLEQKILPVVGLPPPIQNAAFEKSLTNFRNWMKRQAKAASLKVMDFQKPFLDKRKHILSVNLEDGVHPSSKGYQLMSQVAVKVLGGLLED